MNCRRIITIFMLSILIVSQAHANTYKFVLNVYDNSKLQYKRKNPKY